MLRYTARSASAFGSSYASTIADRHALRRASPTAGCTRPAGPPAPGRIGPGLVNGRPLPIDQHERHAMGLAGQDFRAYGLACRPAGMGDVRCERRPGSARAPRARRCAPPETSNTTDETRWRLSSCHRLLLRDQRIAGQVPARCRRANRTARASSPFPCRLSPPFETSGYGVRAVGDEPCGAQPGLRPITEAFAPRLLEARVVPFRRRGGPAASRPRRPGRRRAPARGRRSPPSTAGGR